MTITNQMIKRLEKYTYKQGFPEELIAFLNDKYSEEPWPYEFSEQDLYSNIKRDINAYYAGTLDTTIKSPLQKFSDEIEDLRLLYGQNMDEIRDLNSYIDELHELLWAHGLEGSRMIHCDTHTGTYKELSESLPFDF